METTLESSTEPEQPEKISVSLFDFLSKEQIKQCLFIYKENKNEGTFAKLISEQIIFPHIEEINRKLNQLNDPKYLSYMVEYVFITLEKNKQLQELEKELE